ncbi:hypothetical protein B0H66DRAFT_638412, partial [Apodospora peruviana]
MILMLSDHAAVRLCELDERIQDTDFGEVDFELEDKVISTVQDVATAASEDQSLSLHHNPLTTMATAIELDETMHWIDSYCYQFRSLVDTVRKVERLSDRSRSVLSYLHAGLFGCLPAAEEVKERDDVDLSLPYNPLARAYIEVNDLYNNTLKDRDDATEFYRARNFTPIFRKKIVVSQIRLAILNLEVTMFRLDQELRKHEEEHEYEAFFIHGKRIEIR